MLQLQREVSLRHRGHAGDWGAARTAGIGRGLADVGTLMPRRFSQQYVASASRILALLSHETRLNLVLILAQGRFSVTDLCDHLSLPQSNISHHLSILRHAGLIADEREGQFVIYQLNIDAWRLLGDGFFDQLLSGLDEVTLQHFRIQRMRAPMS